jgi:hypothetical protein
LIGLWQDPYDVINKILLKEVSLQRKGDYEFKSSWQNPEARVALTHSDDLELVLMDVGECQICMNAV